MKYFTLLFFKKSARHGKKEYILHNKYNAITKIEINHATCSLYAKNLIGIPEDPAFW